MGRGINELSVPASGSAIAGGRRRWAGRVMGAGLAGVAMAGVMATVAPSAQAGVIATQAAHTVAPVAQLVEQAQQRVTVPVVFDDAVRPGTSVAAKDVRLVSVPASALNQIPGRHQVATQQTIGISTAVGAGVGAVVGFGIGYLAAPLVGTIASAVVTGVGPALGVALTAAVPPLGAVITVISPVIGVIAWPVAVIATPLVGAAIGAAIGAGVGAAVGTTYANKTVTVPAPARTEAAAPVTPVAKAPTQEDVVKDPTVQNIVTAIDRAITVTPQLGPVGDIARSLLPKQAPKH